MLALAAGADHRMQLRDPAVLSYESCVGTLGLAAEVFRIFEQAVFPPALHLDDEFGNGSVRHHFEGAAKAMRLRGVDFAVQEDAYLAVQVDNECGQLVAVTDTDVDRPFQRL